MINALINSNDNSDQNGMNNNADSVKSSISEKLAEIQKDTISAKESSSPSISLSGQSGNDMYGNNLKKNQNKFKLILGTIFLFLIIIGSGAGFYLSQQTQDLRQQASWTALSSCTTANGLQNLTEGGGANNAGQLGYKPASTDLTKSYDVSKGETVSFKVELQSKSNEVINDWYKLLAFKVVESPTGTKVTENTVIDEKQLHDNLYSQQKDVQVLKYNPAETAFSIPRLEKKTITATWKPTNNDCGLYQIDLEIGGFKTPAAGLEGRSCNGSGIVAAGFVRVVGCTQTVSCTNITGSITNKTTSDPNIKLTGTTTFSGSATRTTFVIHGNFEGPGWSTGWVTYDVTPTNNSYSISKSFNEMVSELKNTGHNEADLRSKGIVYYANVYGPNGYCKGDGQWSNGSGPCTVNPSCNGVIELVEAPPIGCYSACTSKEQCTGVNRFWDCILGKCRLKANPTDLKCQPRVCNSACSVNSECTAINTSWTCDAESGRCRLASNPSSNECKSNVISCLSECTSNTQCEGVNPAWACMLGKCRLKANPTDPKCEARICNSACSVNSECTAINTNWTCDAESGRCRLASNPLSNKCEPATNLLCDQTCSTNEQCENANPAWICDANSNKCRLKSNPTDLKCKPVGCDSACTTDKQCSDVNSAWSCENNKCRLTSNPFDATCQPAKNLVCNDDCTVDKQCKDSNPAWSCVNNKCRLTENPKNTNCTLTGCNGICINNSDCSSVNPAWSCVSNRCRLTTNPSSTTCLPATVYSCNSACTTNAQCAGVNPAWSCVSNKCRLTSNPSSTTCQPATPPMCLDVAILDSDNNEVNPKTTTFAIGDILRFRCAADDPAGQLTRYEYKVTEPNGNIVQGSSINPGNVSPSLEYQITQYLEHKIQCRACTDSGCQDYLSIN